MAAPDLTKRSVCFVAKWGTDDAGYNAVGAPMAKLTIAAALADLAANYPAASATAPHVVSIEPGTYSTPAFALPPFTFITLSHDGPVNPTQGVIILLTGNLTLAAGWATNQTAFGGFANVTIRPNAAQIIDLTLPAPTAGNPSRTLVLRNVITSCDLSFQATGTADAIKLNNVTQDGSSANAIHFAGGAITIRNMESAANVTLIDTATIVAAAQVYGLQITDAAAGLLCSSVGAGFVARLGNCDLRDLTLNETAPGVITVNADAPSIPLVGDLHFTGTAVDADLVRTTDAGGVSGGGVITKAFAAAVPLVTATPKTVAYLDLPAGTWLVSGPSLEFDQVGGDPLITSISSTISLVDNTPGTQGGYNYISYAAPIGLQYITVSQPQVPLTLAALTRVYLVANADFTANGVEVTALILAQSVSSITVQP